ncbi:MAG: CARDB domain-containing protein, partial [Patescibacteria group bacterium]
MKKLLRKTTKKSIHFLFPWIIHYLTDDYKDRKHHLVVDTIFSTMLIVGLLVNISLIYWFVLFLTPVEFDLNMEVAPVIISGEEMKIKIDYHNPNKKVYNSEIQINYPDGFTYKSSTLPPKQGTDNIFALDNLPKDTRGGFEIKGDYLGDINTTDQIAGVSKYEFHGFTNSEFHSTNFQVTNSTLETIIEIPEKILSNEQFNLKVKYKNSSDQTIKDVKVVLDIPDNLIVEDNKKEIIIKKVDPWGEGELLIPAYFQNVYGETSQTVNIATSVGGYTQNNIQNLVEVLSPRIEVVSYINNSPAAISNFDEGVTVFTVVKNIGDAPLSNISVTGNLSNGTNYNWTVYSLEPGQSKTVSNTFSVPSSLNLQNYQLIYTTKAEGFISDLNVQTYSTESTSSVKFTSPINFTANSAYYSSEGEQIGYGPYPLEAGSATALRIFWKVQGTTNNLNNV